MHVWLKESSLRLFVAALPAPAPRRDSPLSRYWDRKFSGTEAGPSGGKTTFLAEVIPIRENVNFWLHFWSNLESISGQILNRFLHFIR